MLRSCLWMSSVFNTIQPIQQNYHLHRLPPGMCFIIFVVDLIHLYSYTSIFPNRHFIKYADNTALVSLLYDGEKEHGSVLDYFLNWCEKSNLLLHISKTKEMSTDFRKLQSSNPTFVSGNPIQSVTEWTELLWHCAQP